MKNAQDLQFLYRITNCLFFFVPEGIFFLMQQLKLIINIVFFEKQGKQNLIAFSQILSACAGNS